MNGFDAWLDGPGAWTKANGVWLDAARQAWRAATNECAEACEEVRDSTDGSAFFAGERIGAAACVAKILMRLRP